MIKQHKLLHFTMLKHFKTHHKYTNFSDLCIILKFTMSVLIVYGQMKATLIPLLIKQNYENMTLKDIVAESTT
jgi:hypothetical protein